MRAKEPAKVDIAIVLHGDATLAVLNADAYAKHFKTTSNPNLDCLRELHEAGVEILVCGQSLIGKEANAGGGGSLLGRGGVGADVSRELAGRRLRLCAARQIGVLFDGVEVV